ALAAEATHLAGEDFVVGVVVGDRGQDRCVGGQGNGGEFIALALEAADQLGGEMLAVGRRAAVAADQEFAAARETGVEQPRGALGWFDEDGARSLLGGKAFGEVGVDARGWRHRPGLYGSRSAKRIAQPVDLAVVDRANVEPARRPGPVAEASLEQVLRLQADAPLLGRRDARGGAAEGCAGAPTHFDEHPL